MTKDWNFNQPLESKLENQEDSDKIAALFGIIKEVIFLLSVFVFMLDCVNCSI